MTVQTNTGQRVLCMTTEPTDQSMNAVPTSWGRVKRFVCKYKREGFLVASFMFFFYGGMVVTAGSPYWSALFAAVLSVVFTHSLIRRD